MQSFEVNEVAVKWLEVNERPRRWFTPRIAARLVDELDLKELLLSLLGQKKKRYFISQRNFETRSACSRMTRALSSVNVPVGSPL
jgi:hypothetical protein